MFAMSLHFTYLLYAAPFSFSLGTSHIGSEKSGAKNWILTLSKVDTNINSIPVIYSFILSLSVLVILVYVYCNDISPEWKVICQHTLLIT